MKMTVTHSKESFEYLNHRHTKNKTPSSNQIKHNNYKRQPGKWNAERKHVFVIQPVVPETTAVGCCKYSWSLHNHAVIEVRTKRALIAREQSERNRLHTRVMLHNANAKEGAGGGWWWWVAGEGGSGGGVHSEHNTVLSLIFRQLPFLVVNSCNNLYHFQNTRWFCWIILSFYT